MEFSRQRARKASADGILTLIAVDGERVVGFADCGRCRDDDLPSAGEVYALYVLKEYCGRGVGTSLMRSALEALRDYRQIAVWVLRKNGRAIRFYEGFGYRFDGREQILQLGTAVAEARMILSR